MARRGPLHAVVETTTLSGEDLTAYCCRRRQYPAQMMPWKQPVSGPVAYAVPRPPQPEIRQRKREPARKAKALAEAAALLVLRKNLSGVYRRDGDD